ncbi:cx9C motif-containing protein 4 [Hetaerina americana]|uniref:cx9C motif-containing protein 4 n=1 Tax=Hetaerina americana TaxID=62018 RepID=UPI003A7F4A92
MKSIKKDPCKLYACRIQKCLKENKFNEESCKDVINEMQKCCDKWFDESLCCSGFKKPAQK